MRRSVRWFPAVGIALAALVISPARAQQPARKIIPLVRVRATLQTALDAKKAKPGEPVHARLEMDVPIPNGPTLPKNTILEGHVDQVQASENHSNSSLVITFDQAKLRSGEVVPVKVTVLSVTETALPATQYENAAPAPEATTGPLSPTTSTRPSNFPAPSGTVRNPAIPESQPQEPQILTPQPEPGTRSIPGVTLQSDVNLSTSATFLSERRNVHVPSGAHMEVAVGVMPESKE